MGDNTNIIESHSFIPGDRLISVNEIAQNESFLRQCIWSDLFVWSEKNEIDLEKYQFNDINNIINKHIDSKRKNKYSTPDFSHEILLLD